jgi:acyl-coenzyme A thioesterase 9
MASRAVPRITSNIKLGLRSARQHQTRDFSTCRRCRTDGVYSELTAMRTRTPFIEAFKKQQNGEPASVPRTEKVERDLRPKTMSDSYHSVVRYHNMTFQELNTDKA